VIGSLVVVFPACTQNLSQYDKYLFETSLDTGDIGDSVPAEDGEIFVNSKAIFVKDGYYLFGGEGK